MVGGQAVAQPHRQIECLVVVHGFEGSFHAHQYIITDGECLFLSDKLLERLDSARSCVLASLHPSCVPIIALPAFGRETIAHAYRRGAMTTAAWPHKQEYLAILFALNVTKQLL